MSRPPWEGGAPVDTPQNPKAGRDHGLTQMHRAIYSQEGCETC